jgi:hypothetical protein
VALSSPILYVIMYRILGFKAAQIAASWKRRLTDWVTRAFNHGQSAL